MDHTFDYGMRSHDQKMHVAVVGAGPSGLSSCRHLLANPERFTFVCYEQRHGIGGIWLPAPQLDATESNTQPTSLAGQQPFTVYKSLRCNLPAVLMQYPGYPLKPQHITEIHDIKQDDLPWHYLAHYDILNYLHAFAEHYELLPHIRLNEQVGSIRLEKTGSAGTEISNHEQYIVKTCNLLTGVVNIEHFDAILVCNGHHARPNWPTIENLSSFTGRIMHCKYYHDPKTQFADCKKVVLVGAMVSGWDIALDFAAQMPEIQVILAGHTEQLLQKEGRVLKGTKVRIVPELVEVVGERSVKLADDSIEPDVDVLIMTTGFQYFFPFFSQNDDGLALDNNDKRLQPLYKHIVHINHPTICFIDLHRETLGFLIFDVQIRYALAMLKGDFKLPKREKMLEWEEADYQMRIKKMGWPHRMALRLANLARQYHDELIKECQVVEPLDDMVFRLIEYLGGEILNNPESFRQQDLRKILFEKK